MNNKSSEENGIEIKKVICWPSPGCSQKCGLIARVKDNKIIGLRGNPDYPGNRGAVCQARFPGSLGMVKSSGPVDVPPETNWRAGR